MNGNSCNKPKANEKKYPEPEKISKDDFTLSLMTAGTGVVPAPLLSNIKYKAKHVSFEINGATQEDLANLGSIYSAKLCEGESGEGCLLNLPTDEEGLFNRSAAERMEDNKNRCLREAFQSMVTG